MKTETNMGALLWAFMVLLVCLPLAASASSVLWSVEHGDQLRGYLLGTLHSEDPRMAEPPAVIWQAMERSNVFAMEIVPDMESLSLLNQAMYHDNDENDLESVIGAEMFDELAGYLEDYGLTRAQALTLRPWAAAVMISVPPPDTGLFMDIAYAMRARAAGLEVISLETVEEQLAFLEGMEPAQEMELLTQAVSDYEQMESIHDELVNLYLGGDLNALQQFSNEQMEGSSEALRSWFQTRGLDQRNRGMVEVMLQQWTADDGSPDVLFTAVGALHLPGENGLIELLRKQGYTLTPIPVTFPES